MLHISRRNFIYGLGTSFLLPAVTSFASQENDEKLFESVEFTSPGSFTSGVEGPACDRDGNLYAVNFDHQGTIGRISPNGEADIFVELPPGSTGNGIRFDQNGNTMYIADYTNHNVLAIDMNSKEITVFAHEPAMKQPNDLAIMSNGILFGSDPNWSRGTGSIWRFDRDGITTKLDDMDSTTNGIEVSPENDTLYVNTSGSKSVWAYDLDDYGDISNKRLLIKFSDYGTDGMRCDIEGNIYVARYGKGVIAVISPEGDLIREIETIGKNPSNIAFGGEDGKTCYVTLADRGNIETFRNDVAGRSWHLFNGQGSTEVNSEQAEPAPFQISSCYPNPFNAMINIDYNLRSDSNSMLRIFNITGQTVEILNRGFQVAGRHSSVWNADASPSGVYFVSLEMNGRRVTEKITLIK